MKAIIPVAGYATRLYPLTENTPKALLPIGGKPMIEWIIDKLNSVKDVDEIIIVTNDRFARNFLDWAQHGRTDKDVHVINDGTKSNDDRLGSLGDIALCMKIKEINEDVLIIGGDNLFDFPLSELVDFARQKDTSAIAVHDIRDITRASQFGIVAVDKSEKITEFAEKPEKPASSLVATMCYYIKKEDAALINQYLAEGNKPDRAGDFIAWLVKRRPVHAYSFQGRWFDIGTSEQYKQVCDLYAHIAHI